MLFGRAKRDAFRQSKGWPIQRSAAEKAAFHDSMVQEESTYVGISTISTGSRNFGAAFP